jgi:hypothetical protein
LGRIPLQGGTGRTRTGIEETGDIAASHQLIRYCSCLAFVEIASNAKATRDRDRRVRLLHYVGQLMGKQLPSELRPWQELAGAKHDVPSHRIGSCVDRFGRTRGVRIGMHPHLAEVMSKARFHEGAGCGVEGLSGGVQHLGDDRRRLRKPSLMGWRTL